MCAVPNMAVFCSSLTSCFPGMLLIIIIIIRVIKSRRMRCVGHVACTGDRRGVYGGSDGET